MVPSVPRGHGSFFFSEDDPTPFDFALNFPLKPVVDVPDGPARSPNVLVLVTTTAGEWKMREGVRNSWANYTSRAVKVEFLIGRPVSSKGRRYRTAAETSE